MSVGLWRRHKKKLIALGVLLVAPVVMHGAVVVGTPIDPPQIAAIEGEPEVVQAEPPLRTLGDAYVRKRGEILEVRLVGTPEQMGHQHGRLLYDEMVHNEGELYGVFEEQVPFAPARWLIMDISRLSFRDVDEGMADERLREIAAQARAFAPDPYEGVLPTFHRFVFLQSLYDISLSFEHSPLLGCTSFALSGDAAKDGHTLLARNFDFEAHPVFDRGKAVFLVFEEGKIPYASVAWPGLVGAVTGVNAEGVSLAVHGGRAGDPRTEGEPVVHTTRRILAEARTTEEAVEILRARAPMVSHIVILADAAGDAAVVERAPGHPLHVRRGAGRLALTNHFEGPLATDPRNQGIVERTSTMPRRNRLDELLSNLEEGASVQDAVEILRDKRGPAGAELPLGHRHALDAVIATHSVVVDATSRDLWVSEGPHLVGRYLRFELSRLLDPEYEPTAEVVVEEIAADEIQASGTYDQWLQSGAHHQGSE